MFSRVVLVEVYHGPHKLGSQFAAHVAADMMAAEELAEAMAEAEAKNTMGTGTVYKSGVLLVLVALVVAAFSTFDFHFRPPG